MFLFFLIFIGEIIIRVFYLSPDIPQREIDKNGIQKFKLNQTGKYNSKLKNKWLAFVSQFSKDHNISYKEAMSSEEAKKEYRSLG